MRVGIVDMLYGTVGVVEALTAELHSVPQIVAAPVLPVLDDAVKRHTVAAVTVYHACQLVPAAVSLAALVKAIGPQRLHRHLAREPSHALDDTVGITSVYEIVVNHLPHLRLQCEYIGTVTDVGG